MWWIVLHIPPAQKHSDSLGDIMRVKDIKNVQGVSDVVLDVVNLVVIPVTGLKYPPENYEWLKAAQNFYIEDTDNNRISIKVK